SLLVHRGADRSGYVARLGRAVAAAPTPPPRSMLRPAHRARRPTSGGRMALRAGRPVRWQAARPCGPGLVPEARMPPPVELRVIQATADRADLPSKADYARAKPPRTGRHDGRARDPIPRTGGPYTGAGHWRCRRTGGPSLGSAMPLP